MGFSAPMQPSALLALACFTALSGLGVLSHPTPGTVPPPAAAAPVLPAYSGVPHTSQPMAPVSPPMMPPQMVPMMPAPAMGYPPMGYPPMGYPPMGSPPMGYPQGGMGYPPPPMGYPQPPMGYPQGPQVISHSHSHGHDEPAPVAPIPPQVLPPQPLPPVMPPPVMPPHTNPHPYAPGPPPAYPPPSRPTVLGPAVGAINGCARLFAPSGSSVTVSATPAGAVARYSCLPGHWQDGGHNTRLCEHYEWSSEWVVIRCVKEVPVPVAPPAPVEPPFVVGPDCPRRPRGRFTRATVVPGPRFNDITVTFRCIPLFRPTRRSVLPAVDMCVNGVWLSRNALRCVPSFFPRIG